MEDKIKNWIKKKLDIPEDSEINILNISMNICEYLVVFTHEGILKTITLYPSISNILEI